MSCDVPVAAVAYIYLAVMIQILYVVEITAVLFFYESFAMWQIENAKWLSDYLINHIVVCPAPSKAPMAVTFAADMLIPLYFPLSEISLLL